MSTSGKHSKQIPRARGAAFGGFSLRPFSMPFRNAFRLMRELNSKTLVLLFAFTFCIPFFVVEGSSAPAVLNIDQIGTFDQHMTHASQVEVVFSDVDGTLVHYPDNIEELQEEPGNRILRLPQSATGTRGVISSRTIRMCAAIRRRGVKLALISGMRTQTLLGRLPYLPRADAYCSEAGGRIFVLSDDGFRVEPVPFDGASTEDLDPFFIREDMTWRARMELADAAGPDGYIGSELDGLVAQVSLSDRLGKLWQFAAVLEEMGYVLDTKGYSTCFRVSRKQQKLPVGANVTFDALANGSVSLPDGLGRSMNLGSIDFYPVSSGKKNWFLAEQFCGTADVLSRKCVCLCDDDNDIEMALACFHAYIPSVTSESMANAIAENPERFTNTANESESGRHGTTSTEIALKLILDRLISDA